MSLIVQITDLITRIGTEIKTMKNQYSGNNTGSVAGLNTTDKSSLLAAINEVNSLASGKQPNLGYTAENTANKGVANGYAALDSGGRVPMAQLPSVLNSNKGYFATLAALTTAYPTASAGDYAIVGATDTVFIWNTDGTPAWIDSDQKGAVQSVNGQTGAVVIGNASTGAAGLMSNTDKSKLDGVAAGATANSTDAILKARASHTGTQTASTISDFAATVIATILSGLSTSTNSVITAADSILVAFGKLQAQITAHFGAGGSVHATVTTSVSGFMSASDKTKLDGVASGANNYTHPSGDGNSHVPVTGTANNLKVLKAGATANSAAWGNVAFSELTNVPATLALHGITDAYTKTEIGDITTNFVNAFNAAIV
ncbi:MAG: hypothetical protein WAO52_02405 [Prolixibacteraceae bacterium]